MQPSVKNFQFEPFEKGIFAILAVAGDVQVGWCREDEGGWSLLDMDEAMISGPFSDLGTAEAACYRFLAHLAGASNPGH